MVHCRRPREGCRSWCKRVHSCRYCLNTLRVRGELMLFMNRLSPSGSVSDIRHVACRSLLNSHINNTQEKHTRRPVMDRNNTAPFTISRTIVLAYSINLLNGCCLFSTPIQYAFLLPGTRSSIRPKLIKLFHIYVCSIMT